MTQPALIFDLGTTYFKAALLTGRDEFIAVVHVPTPITHPQADRSEMAVKDFPNSIIDFGAGHSHFTEIKQLEKVQSILEIYENIILLLPCEDKEKSVEILNKRFKELIKKEQNRSPKESEYLVNREFVYSESNLKIAKKIVYTGGKTPTEVTDEVADLIL